MEIITGVERRRRWRLEDKLRLVAETHKPGACVSQVARCHQVSRSLLTSWRRQFRRGTLGMVPSFVPLRLLETDAALSPAGSPVPATPAPPQPDRQIEISLPDGVVVRVPEEIGTAALRRVLAALRG